MNLYFATCSSPLGILKLQCSEEHVQAVLFSEEGALVQETDHPLLQRCVVQLTEYFAGARREFDLPLQQHGTVFQQAVWSLLQKIPYGKTLSYNELSKQYGDLKAIRAVASANGKNNLSIIVPCHRVIGSNSALTGYAGGLWRKKWLLEHEAKYYSGTTQLGLEI
jgi:methylated-DNA-[protein]-cysteine S-methyltransferase